MTKPTRNCCKLTRNARSEPAFTELVGRHVDFVYSAALRMVGDVHLAEDVTQGVFLALAKNAADLTDRPVLSGWLHRTAQNIAAQTVRTDVRRRTREQEAAFMHELLSANPDADWELIAPHLDDALSELSEPDRDAVLLRYFKNHDLRRVGATLGISDDAAQKRVSRAVERLRESFAKRGITVGASGLVVVISANAVQAAPVGLAVTISTAAALTGTTVAVTATGTATKAIAMTTLQKTILGATLAAAIGTGVYEALQASNLRTEVQSLHQQQAPLAERIEQLSRERDETGRQLVALRDENDRLNRNTSELLRLRGEVGQLRRQIQENTNRIATGETPPLSKGFGALGEYLPAENVFDAGNETPEALLRTFVWAIREGKPDRLKKIGAPFGGQREPGDVVGELAKSEAAMFKMMQNTFTNVAGFRLSSRPTADGRKYDVRLEADPLAGGRVDEFFKNFNISFVLERTPDGWSFGNPSEDSASK